MKLITAGTTKPAERGHGRWKRGKTVQADRRLKAAMMNTIEPDMSFRAAPLVDVGGGGGAVGDRVGHLGTLPDDMHCPQEASHSLTPTVLHVPQSHFPIMHVSPVLYKPLDAVVSPRIELTAADAEFIAPDAEFIASEAAADAEFIAPGALFIADWAALAAMEPAALAARHDVTAARAEA